MEGSTAPSLSLIQRHHPQFEPDTEAIKRKLLKNGVYPTHKIVHRIRKKEIQKHNRKLNKTQLQQQQQQQQQEENALTTSQKEALLEETHFQTLKIEYKEFNKAIKKGEIRKEREGLTLAGVPWERIERVKLKEIASGSVGKLRKQSLRELKEVFEGNLRWAFLDDDVEVENEDWLRSDDHVEEKWNPGAKRWRREKETIQFLVDRLSDRQVSMRDWKLARIMKQSGLQFSEDQMLKILEELGKKGKWAQASVVVEWVYNCKDLRDWKSRFVYTKLLKVLNKNRRPQEALRIFNLMQEDCSIYPDMAAYHSIAVTLGQAGLLKELVKIIECMRLKPKKIGTLRSRDWDPVLEPDLVIYNAVLNACVPSRQWKGVSWVFQQLRKSGLKPNGATYGLAMEVMLHAGKYDSVHEFFKKMNRSGEAPKAITYKVLVRAFWEEGKINEAVEAVRDMEQRGVVGAASVYYELACCLCHNGRHHDAMEEVGKMKRLRHCKPLEHTFTGMIMSALDGGHVNDCISIFEQMKSRCVPNTGTINAMLKVYGHSDMFFEAKKLFEEIHTASGNHISFVPDEYTYGLMLEASGSALQWEYFEYVYKEMAFAGYQLDQSNHASLLVKASRAGKRHLLEHAFDAILEAGEIPHPLFFIEMIFQATAEQNYERAVTLVKTAAHAPFQVSERQWTDLFDKSRDKISRDRLGKLLKAVDNCDIKAEATVTNLSRALHSLCGCRMLGDLRSSIASGVDHTDNSQPRSELEEIARNGGCIPSSTASTMEGNAEIDGDRAGSDTDFESDRLDISNSLENHPDTLSSPEVSVSDLNQMTLPCATINGFEDKAAAGTSADFSESSLLDVLTGDVDDDDVELEIAIDKDYNSLESKLPSAHHILDDWKESRRKDGIFLPFRLGHEQVPKNVR